MNIRDIMTQPAISCRREANLATAARLMVRGFVIVELATVARPPAPSNVISCRLVDHAFRNGS